MTWQYYDSSSKTLLSIHFQNGDAAYNSGLFLVTFYTAATIPATYN